MNVNGIATSAWLWAALLGAPGSLKINPRQAIPNSLWNQQIQI